MMLMLIDKMKNMGDYLVFEPRTFCNLELADALIYHRAIIILVVEQPTSYYLAACAT